MNLNLVACAAVIVMTSSTVFANEVKPVEKAPISKAEIITEVESQTPRIFEQLDTNQDGKVSQQEAQVSPALVKGFDKIDANKDGFLSLDEFSQLQVEVSQTRKYIVLAALQAL